MSNEIAKYKNELNKIQLGGFGKVESDLFFTIASKIKDQGCKKIVLSFNDVMALSDFKKKHDFKHWELKLKLEQMVTKLFNINFRIETADGTVVKFVLFQLFEIRPETKTIIVMTAEPFECLFNNWTGGYTAFRLQEYVNLKSIYSKHMYRLLKQWRTVGTCSWTIEEWRTLLEIPISYRMHKIDEKVLKPIISELSPIFKNLSIEKIKGPGRGQGGKVIAIRFSFVVEKKEYGEYTQQSDMKTKREKLADLAIKIANGEATDEMILLYEQIKSELAYMSDNNIDDSVLAPHALSQREKADSVESKKSFKSIFDNIIKQI